MDVVMTSKQRCVPTESLSLFNIVFDIYLKIKFYEIQNNENIYLSCQCDSSYGSRYFEFSYKRIVLKKEERRLLKSEY